MKPRLVIRADANTKIGSGHLMRCLALAQGWQNAGGEALFLTCCANLSLRTKLASEGFEVFAIDESAKLNDPQIVLKFLNQLYTPDAGVIWIALDGYNFESDYQQTIRDSGYRLLVIDDTAHLPHYHADVLLNQNLYARELSYRCDNDTLLLLGSNYALIRQEFRDWRTSREIAEQASRVLVTLGGADPGNITFKAIEALQASGVSGLQARVVVGPDNPNIDALREALAGTEQIALVENANMPESMMWADAAISGGGTTCWELAFLGVPFIILVVAENQLRNARALDQADIAMNLGWHHDASASGISDAITNLLRSPTRRHAMSQHGQGMIDDKGTERVLAQMKKRSLRLKKMSANDCELVWTWANEEETRASSFSSAPIPWTEHVKWFEAKIADPNSWYYLVLDWHGEPIGQIRYDVKDDEAVVSVSLDRTSRGFGYGSEIIRQASAKLFDESPVRLITAFVKKSNEGSLRAFAKAGYELKCETEVRRQAADCLELTK